MTMIAWSTRLQQQTVCKTVPTTANLNGFDAQFTSPFTPRRSGIKLEFLARVYLLDDQSTTALTVK